MSGEIAIHVEHVSKEFKVYLDKGYSLKERLLFKNRRKYEERHVLKDISFDVKKGEAIGLVGQNGCGKSTLLKLLSRIMYPDTGSVEIYGRVSALIELGAGFHPDMSGRENIYTNAAIFGLTKQEIDDRVQSIIDFSELEEYIDNPVRTYSSGMYMRLAFSVAINVDADILLIDEILAVGDAAFQAKCFNKLREIKRKGTTIVIVSHALSQIEQICERSLWIHDGLIKEEGSPVDVHVDYMRYMSQRDRSDKQNEMSEEKEKVVFPQGKDSLSEKEKKIVSISRIYLTSPEGEEKNRFATGQPAILHIEYNADIQKIDKGILIGILVFRNDGVIAYGTNTRNEKISDIRLKPTGTVLLRMSKLNLGTGQYWIDIAFRKMDMTVYDYCRHGCSFDVMSTCSEVGIAKIEHQWIIP